LRRTAALLLLFATPVWNQPARARIVSVGTSITQTLCALGFCGELVASDTASKNWIPEASQLPSVGAFRSIAVEGIVSLKPSHVFLAFDTGPEEAVKQLRDARVNVIVAPRNYTLDEVKNTVRFLAARLNCPARGEETIRTIESDMRRVVTLQKRMTSHPKVVFCSLGANAPTGSISGANTRIDEIIRLSGGINPIRSFEGMRPMTDEGVIAVAPDIILVTERAFEHAGGMDAILKLPGVALTPAGRARRIIPVSDVYFQGFGPDIGKAVLALTAKLHAELR
jgi:iron complex transport system substrate-binding protein